MLKTKSVKEILDNIIDVEMPAIMESIVADKELRIEVKAARLAQAQTARHQLIILRGAVET